MPYRSVREAPYSMRHVKEMHQRYKRMRIMEVLTRGKTVQVKAG